MNRQQRKKFLQEIKADVKQYSENINADSKTKASLDSRLISKDWQKVQEDIKFGIKNASKELTR